MKNIQQITTEISSLEEEMLKVRNEHPINKKYLGDLSKKRDKLKSILRYLELYPEESLLRGEHQKLCDKIAIANKAWRDYYNSHPSIDNLPKGSLTKKKNEILERFNYSTLVFQIENLEYILEIE